MDGKGHKSNCLQKLIKWQIFSWEKSLIYAASNTKDVREWGWQIAMISKTINSHNY